MGKEYGALRIQRAAGRCEAARIRTKSPLSRALKAKASKQPRFPPLTGSALSDARKEMPQRSGKQSGTAEA